MTLDVNDPYAENSLTFLQATDPRVAVFLEENGTPYQDLSGSTGHFYYAASATNPAFVHVSTTNIDINSGKYTFDFTDAHTNTNGDFFAWVMFKSSNGRNIFYGELDLTIKPSGILSGAELLFGETVDFGTVTTYSNTTNAGPYLAGSNVSFRAATSGRYYIDSGLADLVSLSNDVLAAWATASNAYSMASAAATGTPLYAYTETDPVWESEKSAYATGTPVYAETDPVWELEKGSYATGTPLYAYTETDPVWESEKSAYATGTPLYVESAETDPVWESEKSAYATGTPLYVESAETDPVWATASNRYAVVGPLTVDPVDLDMTWDGAIWTNAVGYSSDGTNNAELGGWVLDPEEYIQTPLLAGGYHHADIECALGGAFADLERSYSRDGVTFEEVPEGYDPTDGQPTIVRFSTDNLPPIGTNFYAIVTNLVIYGYKYPPHVIQTNDHTGVELRIRDSYEPESPVRQDEFDAANEAIWTAVTNTYAPGVVGIDLEGNVLTFGSYWDAQQIEDALVFSFAGNPVFTLSNGGTVIVSVASFSFDGEEIDMRVVCSALLEPTPQWSTNMTDWTSYSTNDFTTTWPNLTNGIALLEFAAQTGETAAVYYRAIAAGTNAGPGTATLTVPLIVNGTITADGFIGDGSGLTNIIPTESWIKYSLEETITNSVPTNITGTLHIVIEDYNDTFSTTDINGNWSPSSGVKIIFHAYHPGVGHHITFGGNRHASLPEGGSDQGYTITCAWATELAMWVLYETGYAVILTNGYVP